MNNRVHGRPCGVDPDVPPQLHPLEPLALDVAFQGRIFDDAAVSKRSPDPHHELRPQLATLGHDQGT
jgi:hypothetical protein